MLPKILLLLCLSPSFLSPTSRRPTHRHLISRHSLISLAIPAENLWHSKLQPISEAWRSLSVVLCDYISLWGLGTPTFEFFFLEATT